MQAVTNDYGVVTSRTISLKSFNTFQRDVLDFEARVMSLS